MKTICKVIAGSFAGEFGRLHSKFSTGLIMLEDRHGDQLSVTEKQIERLEVRTANLNNPTIQGLIDIDGSIKYGFNSGGYESNAYFITADGGTLAINTVISEIDKVDFCDDCDPQWHIVHHGVNYEEPDLLDSHTGEPIPAAYSDDD